MKAPREGAASPARDGARSKLAVDIGGTFTDVVFRAREGEVATAKVPTTPQRIADAVVLGTERAGAHPAGVDVFIHGTTIALNALLEGKTPPVGLVTEKGLRLFEAKRKSEAKKAESLGVSMERVEIALPEDGPNGV